MKKILLITLFALFTGSAFSQQINIDGFILGSDEGSTVFQGINNNFIHKREADNWVEYEKGGSTYTIYFEKGILVKISKIRKATNTDVFESFVAEEYFDIVSEHGDPAMSGDSYAFWRIGKHKISFRYDIVTDHYQDPSRLFGEMKTVHILTIQTIVE